MENGQAVSLVSVNGAVLMPAEAPAPNPAPTNPMQMLALAVANNADIDKLTKLMDLHERMEAREARNAYVAAVAQFKANPPALNKNKTVSFQTSKGKTEYKHATLDSICDAVGKRLSEYGLSFAWKVEQLERHAVRVTCTLRHIAGHAETVTLEAPPDDSGNKNSIQQIGSTVTYLQRYTLLAILGMATGEQDDDGRGGAVEAQAGEDPRKQFLQSIRSADSLEELQVRFKAAYIAAKTAKDNAGLALFTNAKDARKKELLDKELLA